MKNINYFFLVLLLLSSCSVFDRDEDLPAFLVVDKFDFTAGNFQGTDSTNISEVRITLEGQNLGLFELPAVVPVLAKGSNELTLSAVIQQDGIATTRVLYPFYTSWSSDVNFSELDTVSVTPSIEYFDDLDFWIENFDSSVSFEESDDSDGELIKITGDLVYEGAGSAFIQLEDDADYFYAESTEGFNLPAGTAVFLEMNYSCTHPFVAGIKAYSGVTQTSTDLIGLNATTPSGQEWNKIYINLTNFVADNSGAASYEIYFKMDRSDIFPEPFIYLDNLKVIY